MSNDLPAEPPGRVAEPQSSPMHIAANDRVIVLTSYRTTPIDPATRPPRNLESTVVDPKVREAIHVFRDFLRTRALRVTGARDALIEAVFAEQGHFHVETLFRRVRERGHKVSKATIYRAVPLLVEAGILQPTEVSSEAACFELAFGRDHHDHLICARCRTIIEFQFEAFETLQREVAAKFGFELTGHVHELIGVCAPCRMQRHVQPV